jgi:hypothetical protein
MNGIIQFIVTIIMDHGRYFRIRWGTTQLAAKTTNVRAPIGRIPAVIRVVQIDNPEYATLVDINSDEIFAS